MGTAAYPKSNPNVNKEGISVNRIDTIFFYTKCCSVVL